MIGLVKDLEILEIKRTQLYNLDFIMIKKLLLVIFILLSTINCQVAGKNPEEAAIPIIEPTVAKKV